MGSPPLVEAGQVRLIVVFETGVAKRPDGADGVEGTIACTMADIGDRSPAVSAATTA
jgi:hypothetical protein